MLMVFFFSNEEGRGPIYREESIPCFLALDKQMLVEGQQLGGYRLLHRIVGAYPCGEEVWGTSRPGGHVYLAADMLLGQYVAIKIFDIQGVTTSDSSASQEVDSLLKHGTSAIAGLEHPHLLPLLDSGQIEIALAQHTYVVMPFCQEGSLTHWLEQHRPSRLLALHEVAGVLHQLADVLDYLHNQGVIHGNVKPSNILVRSCIETPACLDVLLADVTSKPQLTTTVDPLQPIGTTSPYEAPERRRGIILPASDQYSLAVVAYELLTGHLPFHQRQIGRTEKYLHEPSRPPSILDEHIPKEINDVILRALAESPQDRFPSIAAFASAFELALPDRDNLHATLVISPAEARSGCDRSITLPGGEHLLLSVPPDAHEGQTITVEGVKDPSAPGSRAITLTITLTISPPEEELVPLVLTSGKRPSRQSSLLARGNIFLLVGLVLLLVGGSIGFLSYLNTLARRPSYTATTLITPSPSVGATGTATANATATFVAATTNPYPPYRGTLVMNGTLKTANPSLPNNPTCRFIGSAYDIRAQQGEYQTCAGGPSFSNFVVEVSMTIFKGNCGGIMLRTNNASSNYYLFEICSNAQYGIFQYVGPQVSGFKTLKVGHSSSIRTGAGQINVLAVVANGSNFTLYVNRQAVEHLSEGSYTTGRMGFIADGSNFGGKATATEVVYLDQKVWLI